MPRSLLLAVVLIVASLANVPPAGADPREDKVGSALRDLQATKNRSGDAQPAAADALLDITKTDRVMVDVFVDGPVTDAVAELEANGMKVLATATRPLPVVAGRLPLDRLDAVAALDVVKGIQPVVGGGTDDWPGTKGTEGDTAHRGPAARALGGGDPLVRGKGVKVGIISDSIDQLGGGIADSVANGNLPSGRVVSLLDDTTGVIDEGRAMAEIVYDTVPGVEEIVFSSGTSAGAVGKAASIDALVAQGVKVIGDDIFYLSEPFFQDGQVAQAVNRAKAAGVTYFASAGNRARQSWEGTYTDSGGFHNFAGGDTTQGIVTVPPGSFIQVALQWNEPWGSATTDIDALLTKADGTALPSPTSGGQDDNLAGGLPSELVTWGNNTGGPVAVGLRIQRFDGSASPFMKYIARGPGTFTIAEHATNSDTINPDAASAAGSIAVAAVNAADPGLDTVEDFSSRGLKTRLRDENGAPLPSPVVLQKPQLAAADAISTSVPGFETFFGTSAAVPSAVGIAALLKWARPTLTPSQIEAIMTDPARSTDCLPVGIRPDADCGAGFAYADASLQALDSTGPNVVANVTGPSGANGWQTGDATVDWTVTDPESVITGSCARVVITADTTGTTRECQATSIGGSTLASVTVKRDSTPPLPPVITGINGGSFSEASLPPVETIVCSSTDATSGVATCAVAGYSRQAGSHTLTATATDNAGLQSRTTLTYQVSTKATQSAKAPPKKLQQGARKKLAKTTRQGSSLRWKTLTTKTCVVKKGTLVGKRAGECRVRATAPAVAKFSSFAKTYKITIR